MQFWWFDSLVPLVHKNGRQTVQHFTVAVIYKSRKQSLLDVVFLMKHFSHLIEWSSYTYLYQPSAAICVSTTVFDLPLPLQKWCRQLAD